MNPAPPIPAEFHVVGRNILKAAMGRKFSHRGCDGVSGFDCRGIVVHFFRALGLPMLPTPDDDTYPADYWRRPDGRYLRRLEEQFDRVPDRCASFGDIYLFRPNDARIEDVAHTGIVDDPAKGTFVHAFLTRGIAESNINERYWATRLFGVMRHRMTGILATRRAEVPAALR